MQTKDQFTFEISLSVLDHLGRNLYRSFQTVLGEAISNSWDADAKNVRIYINREKNSFFIKDDGDGMTSDDFQKKFLKIGYSKRSDGRTTSPGGRPFIGRKGIGKLALLSCAGRVHVISKTKSTEYVGGVIDNSGLDHAITEDLTVGEYRLGEYNLSIFNRYTEGHEKGTIIYFENIKDGIRNRLKFLKKIIALYFRFSLLDESFNVFIDGEIITLDDLKDLSEKTQFLWRINKLVDPYIDEKLTKLKEPVKDIEVSENVKGFIASVSKPRDLKVIGTDERVSIDLFVNGRLRERDILKHIPTSRLAENYFYGQIHFDNLDDDEDRFTTSRESIVADDPKYKKLLDDLKKAITEILEDWDKWRIKHRQVGDAESERISRKKRASLGLYNAVSGEFEPPDDSENRQKVSGWVDGLKGDAAFNFEAYAECFVSENLVRKYIHEKNLPISEVSNDLIDKWREREATQKQQGNLNINIRRNDDDLSYLDMTSLVKQADTPGVQNTLHNDAKEYRPIRNAMAHTALLTDEAKRRLTTVYDNIKARIKVLLSGTEF